LKTHPKSYDEFVAKYPTLFRGNLVFGIECNRGWYRLLDTLMDRIVKYEEGYDYLPNDYHYAEATQIKEKFGTLRFYFMGGNDTIEGMIMFAEDMSEMICEECGDGGRLGAHGHWMMTRCKKCQPEGFKEIE
jgi:hypothetical protein